MLLSFYKEQKKKKKILKEITVSTGAKEETDIYWPSG